MAGNGESHGGGGEDEKNESITTGPAMWKNADHDEPVIVTGFAGEKDGKKYVYVEGSTTAIPLGEIDYTKKPSEKMATSKLETAKSKLEEAKDSKRDKMAARLKRRIDKVEISTLDELRDATRLEVFELLGYEKEDEDIKEMREFKKFTNDIVFRVKSILDDGNAIFNEIQREQDLIKKCYEKTKSLFHNEGYCGFLGFLASKKIDADGKQLTMPSNILTILKLSKDPAFKQSAVANDNNAYEDFSSFADGDPRYFLASIEATEKLYKKWEAAEVEKQDAIDERIEECQKNLSTLSSDLQDHPEMLAHISDIAENDKDWGQIRAGLENNLTYIKKLNSGSPSNSDRKLAAAFLNGNESEIADWRDIVQAGIDAKTEAEIAHAKEVRAAEDAEEDEPGNPEGISAPNFASGEAGDGSFKWHQRMSDVVTANGRITWYSWNDFEKMFETIKQSVEAHVDQASGSKGGLLAMYPTKWMGKDVHTRWSILDNQGDRDRTSKILPNMKNYKYEQLLADIGKRPKVGVDRRRAALEVLAERGNLRMSDPRLLEAIGAFGGNHPISKEKWENAQKTGDYSDIRVAFKHCIDGEYIGEPNYGEELLEKQTQGADHKKEFGKKINDYGMAGTPAAEVHSIFHQIDEGNLEGDNTIIGQTERSFERGNIWSGNGEFQTTFINCGREEKDEGKKITANASSGFVALKIIDGYLQGQIDAETINNISKSGESGGYNPFAAFQELVIKRAPGRGDMFVSKIEDWGWVKGHEITDLGRTEIIKFFDSRTAEDIDGNARHVGVDSTTYAEHSGRHNSIGDFKGKVGDKMLGACLKGAGGPEIYNAATQYNSVNKQLSSENREVAALIRATTEEIQDAIKMKSNARYTNGIDKSFIKNVNDRLDRGYEGLTTMLENMMKHTKDRALTNATWDAYQLLETDEHGMYKKRNGPLLTKDRNDLRGFLEKQLDVLKAADRSKYNSIMRSVTDLYDQSKNHGHDVWQKIDSNKDQVTARSAA